MLRIRGIGARLHKCRQTWTRIFVSTHDHRTACYVFGALVQGYINADKLGRGYSYARMITVPHATDGGAALRGSAFVAALLPVPLAYSLSGVEGRPLVLGDLLAKPMPYPRQRPD